MTELIGIFLAYFVLGAFAGTMSGLLGIGGGLLVVPGLAYLFRLQHFNSDILMHMAAGTSFAIMLLTTSRSLWAHLRYHIKFWSIYRRLAPGVIIGTILGALLAHQLHSRTLSIVFAIFVFVVAIKMLTHRREVKAHPHHLPKPWLMTLMGSIIGAKSGLLGVGGGALTIPFLTYCHVEMRRAVLVSIATGMTVAVIGAISFAFTGSHDVRVPPNTIGYLYWPAWIWVACGSVIFAPLGAKWSHRMSTRYLKRTFAVFLIFVGLHLLFSFP